MGWRTYELEGKVARLEEQNRKQNEMLEEMQSREYERMLRQSAEQLEKIFGSVDTERVPGFDTLHSGVERDGYVLEVELEEDDFYFKANYQLMVDVDGDTVIVDEDLKQMKEDYHNIIEKYYPCGFYAYLEYVAEEAIRIDYSGDIEGFFFYPRS